MVLVTIPFFVLDKRAGERENKRMPRPEGKQKTQALAPSGSGGSGSMEGSSSGSCEIKGGTDPTKAEIAGVKQRIREILEHRISVVELQRALEDAWRSAVSDCLALNRKLQSCDLPDSPEKQILVEAEAKQRRMEALQQHAFLMFQTISENKYEEQIVEGRSLLEELENLRPETAGTRTEAFLVKENAINRELLRKFSETRRTLASLTQEATAIKALPCQPKELKKHLDHDLKLLVTFLRSTGELLGLDRKDQLDQIRQQLESSSEA
jgi:hypothetical protein